MTNNSYKDFLRKLNDVKNKYSKEELTFLNLKSIEQFAFILNSLEHDEDMRIYHGEKLHKYLDSFNVVGPSTLTKKYVEKTKAKYYYPVLRYLHKTHKYFRGGWWGILLIFYLPMDLLIYFLNPYQEFFLPVLSFIYFSYMMIKFFVKKKRGMVLIEDE